MAIPVSSSREDGPFTENGKFNHWGFHYITQHWFFSCFLSVLCFQCPQQINESLTRMIFHATINHFVLLFLLPKYSIVSWRKLFWSTFSKGNLAALHIIFTRKDVFSEIFHEWNWVKFLSFHDLFSSNMWFCFKSLTINSRVYHQWASIYWNHLNELSKATISNYISTINGKLIFLHNSHLTSPRRNSDRTTTCTHPQVSGVLILWPIISPFLQIFAKNGCQHSIWANGSRDGHERSKVSRGIRQITAWRERRVNPGRVGLGDLDVTFDRKSACSACMLSGCVSSAFILYLDHHYWWKLMKPRTVFQLFKPELVLSEHIPLCMHKQWCVVIIYVFSLRKTIIQSLWNQPTEKWFKTEK